MITSLQRSPVNKYPCSTLLQHALRRVDRSRKLQTTTATSNIPAPLAVAITAAPTDRLPLSGHVLRHFHELWLAHQESRSQPRSVPQPVLGHPEQQGHLTYPHIHGRNESSPICRAAPRQPSSAYENRPVGHEAPVSDRLPHPTA